MADNITLEHLRDLSERADRRLDALEAASGSEIPFTLLSGGWTADSGDALRPYRYVLAAEGVTAASRAWAYLDEAGEAEGAACGLSVNLNTEEGAVTFTSISAPGADISGVLTIK